MHLNEEHISSRVSNSEASLSELLENVFGSTWTVILSSTTHRCSCCERIKEFYGILKIITKFKESIFLYKLFKLSFPQILSLDMRVLGNSKKGKKTKYTEIKVPMCIINVLRFNSIHVGDGLTLYI